MFFKNTSRFQPVTVHLISDTDKTGRQAYYFIKVKQRMLAKFLAVAKSSEPVNFADFGEIAYSAYGDYPPKHIQDWARKELGWNG
jgi:hypothetical protein